MAENERDERFERRMRRGPVPIITTNEINDIIMREGEEAPSLRVDNLDFFATPQYIVDGTPRARGIITPTSMWGESVHEEVDETPVLTVMDGPPEPEDVYEGLYDRQKKLDLDIPEKVCIIGVGGIGSWVAINLGLVGVKNIFLIDYDVLEEHNLNRTLFRDFDIRTKKVSAVMDLILERRNDINVRTFDKRVEELTPPEIAELSECILIDCRDVLEKLPEELNENHLIKLGYDGLSITMILNPDYGNIWEVEENRGYEIVPSFLAPCQFLATALTTMVTDPGFSMEDKDNDIVTFDLREHFNGLFQPP